MTINNIEDAYSKIIDYLTEFIDGRPWDKSVVVFSISQHMTKAEHWLESHGIKKFDGLFKNNSKVIWNGVDAAIFIRENIFQSAGEYIWGLKFTLYPDGKFIIDYDYNKPESYEEDVDLDKAGTNAEEPLNWLREKTLACESWGLGSEESWNLDMDKGLLEFSFPDGRIATVQVQIVGTLNMADSSFLWGWDHPSVPSGLRRAAEAVKNYGENNSNMLYTERMVKCNEEKAWEFTALAAQLDQSEGAYRGRSGNTWIYMVFGAPVNSN